MFVVGNHQFENLNWMVEYYSKHELYNGVCLKYSVNPETIELYSKDVSNAPEGSYIDVQKLEKVNFCFLEFSIKIFFILARPRESQIRISSEGRSRVVVS